MNKPINVIRKEEVLDLVVRLVCSCKSDLLVTMLLNEEKGEIPKRYKEALLEALDRGVSVKRVCFGSKRELNRYVTNFDKRIEVVLVENERYHQRMVVADSAHMIFRLGRSFFCELKDKSVIQAFISYINQLKTI